jgi:hypothetical protein
MPRFIVTLMERHNHYLERTVEADDKQSALEQVVYDPEVQEYFNYHFPLSVSVHLEFNNENLPALLLDVSVQD